ncbi:hypothetical protein OPV22_002749 [Ensete ventricosum]|uniref:Uncharacterized protein n=1 Tax=Ensete ventricosum TaxID=4639 RepID=A0AAV8RYW1_ENSVE|nr:hypothetical protein OPV22_002749 [Ensete ventricosum]
MLFPLPTQRKRRSVVTACAILPIISSLVVHSLLMHKAITDTSGSSDFVLSGGRHGFTAVKVVDHSVCESRDSSVGQTGSLEQDNTVCRGVIEALLVLL